MPRSQGTSRKGKPKKEMRSAGFGKALQRSAYKQYIPKSNGSSAHGQGMMSTGAGNIGIHEQTDSEKMKSVLEMDNLSDFLVQAQLANKDFISEREQFLNIDNVAQEYIPTGHPTGAIIHTQDEVRNNQNNLDTSFAFHELSVPRRPKWIPGVTTPEELDIMENETFLNWRRGVAMKEEEIAQLAFEQQKLSNVGHQTHVGASVTPYEKNLHVWRQLWRVLERSSIVLQIVDARNPLFYLSDDLRSYAMDELGKPMLILVNKSDYLTPSQRKVWSAYFKERGYNHLFFSAYEEQKKIDKEASAVKKGEVLFDNDETEEEKAVVSDDDEQDVNDTPSDAVNAQQRSNSSNSSDEVSLGITNLLTREQLLDALETFAKSNGCSPNKKYDNKIQYGLVGFPNVGKSSVINVLVGSSKNIHGVVRVGVAAQPGKTKHFQTLHLPDRLDMMLCDCPGLVFPSFVSSTADMIAAGVYPIAQMRDHWPVVSLICKRVPRDVLNAYYGIHIPEPSEQELREKGLWDGSSKKILPPPTAEELLGTYCIARSMLAPSSGVPDYQRASRIVVKDYSEGKLLYCHSPPAINEDGGGSSIEDKEYQQETLKTAIRNTNNIKKLQKLEHSLEVAAKADQVQLLDDDDLLDEFDDILGGNEEKNGDKRGKAHKKIKKHGKKGRKLRNKDPYGCHTDPDSVLQTSTSSGAVVSAGKYSSSGFTRASYGGAKAAMPFEQQKGRKGRSKMSN